MQEEINFFNLIENQDIEGLKRALIHIKEHHNLYGDDLDMPPAQFLEKNAVGDSLLHAALKKNNLALFQELLKAEVPFMIVEGNGLDPVCDNEGNSVLHTAANISGIEFIQELLFVDFPLNTVNRQNKTVIQLGEERAERTNTDADHAISALLRTRQAWQDEAAGFRFNRVVRLIEDAFPEVKPARNKQKLLVIGRTGAGKSTLLNYINGARYELRTDPTSGKSWAELVEGQDRAVAAVGMGMVSQTLYPQVIERNDLDYVYCDLAGLFDSRTDEERICAASSVQILSRLPGDIKGILVVLDLPSFMPKGDSFKKTALALAKMIKETPELLDSIHFSVTHIPQNLLTTISGEGILGKFVRPVLAYYKKQEERRPLDPEENSLKFMLELIVRGGSAKISFPNITDRGESKVLLETKLAGLTANGSNKFDFISHDGSQESFNAVLLKIAHEYINGQRLLRDLPEVIAVQDGAIAEEQGRIAQWNDEVRVLNENINRPFDPTFIDQQIAAKNLEVTNNSAAITQKNARIQTLSNDILAKQQELAQLDTNERIPVTTLRENFNDKRREHRVIYTSPHPLGRINPQCWGWGSYNYILEKPKNTNDYGVDDDGVRVRYYEWDDDAKAGNYQALHKWSEGIDRIETEIFTAKRHLHRARIADLRREINDAYSERSRLQREVIGHEQRNTVLRQEILNAKTAKIHGQAQHDINVARMRREAEQRREWVANTQRLVDEAQTRRTDLEKQLRRVQAELRVNSKLFEIVYKVTRILELFVDHIPAFHAAYESNNPNARREFAEQENNRAQQPAGVAAQLYQGMLARPENNNNNNNLPRQPGNNNNNNNLRENPHNYNPHVHRPAAH